MKWDARVRYQVSDLSKQGTSTLHPGTVYLSTNFCVFASTTAHACTAIIPFFTVKRVERITATAPTISLTLWHGTKILIVMNGDKKAVERWSGVLKDRLQQHVGMMKGLKSFITTCASEDLLHDREPTTGGLGLKFGWIEKRSGKERQKIKYWVGYMKGFC